jgi:type IV fimbrial biogenesis protein FimT
MHTRHDSQRGYTAVELLLATLLAAVLLTLAAPTFSGFWQRRQIEGASSQLQADLHFLRHAASTRQQSLRLSVLSNAAGSCYLIHSGEAGNCRCDPQQPAGAAAQCSSPAQLLRGWAFPAAGPLRLRSNVASMRVDPRQGTFSPAGSLDLDTLAGHHMRHVVNILGRVRLCSSTRTAGLPAC